MNISSCFSPVRVRRPDGRFDYVACGKCDACRNNYNLSWIERLHYEYSQAVKVLFVTFTYNDEFVPKAFFLPHFIFHQFDLDNTTNRHTRQFQRYDCDFLRSAQDVGSFNVVCDTDVRNLVKILKIYGIKRYFIVQEYGPESFRPHLHGLFFYRSSDRTQIAKCTTMSFFDEIWRSDHIRFTSYQRSLGFVDLEECYDEKACNYCASYINSVVDCPLILREVFRCKSFKPTKPRLGLSPHLSRLSTQVLQGSSRLEYVTTDFRGRFNSSTSLRSYVESTLYPRFSGLDLFSVACQEKLIDFLSKLPKNLRKGFYDTKFNNFARSFVDLSALDRWLRIYLDNLESYSIKKLSNYISIANSYVNKAIKSNLSLYDYLVNRQKYYRMKCSSRLKEHERHLDRIRADPYEPDTSQLLMYDYIDESYFDIDYHVNGVSVNTRVSSEDSPSYQSFKNRHKFMFDLSVKTKHSNSNASKRHKVRYKPRKFL